MLSDYAFGYRERKAFQLAVSCQPTTVLLLADFTSVSFRSLSTAARS